MVTRTPPSVTRPVTSVTPRLPSVVTRPSGDVRFPTSVDRPSGSSRLPSGVSRGDYDRSPRSPSVVTRPAIPSTRYPSGGTYDPQAGTNRYPSQSGYPNVQRFSGHRHFTDSSRFASIDRRTSYSHYPHSHYRMNYCNGYRGMGWYYGPPNYSYYYEAPYVTYYSSRSLITSTLLSLVIGGDYGYRNSADYEVQRALYELGYYNGPLDGDIGPMSRLAIANFQADNGLEPTGYIDGDLLYYLNIQ
jgi:N-acetylmuramoyl-L-alanine amidase